QKRWSCVHRTESRAHESAKITKKDAKRTVSFSCLLSCPSCFRELCLFWTCQRLARAQTKSFLRVFVPSCLTHFFSGHLAWAPSRACRVGLRLRRRVAGPSGCRGDRCGC